MKKIKRCNHILKVSYITKKYKNGKKEKKRKEKKCKGIQKPNPNTHLNRKNHYLCDNPKCPKYFICNDCGKEMGKH